MATKREKITKDGRRYYEFRSKPSRDEPEHTMRYYFPEGWSRKSIDREADKLLADFERDVKAGLHKTKQQKKKEAALKAAEEAKRKTVSEYVNDVYFKKIELSENARSTYEAQLRIHILPLIGGMKIEAVTPEDIENVLDARKSESCAYESMLKLYTVLRSVFKMYYSKKAKENPMLEVQRPKQPPKEEIALSDADELLEAEDDDENGAYTPEELNIILEVAQDEPLKWRLYISIITDTGVRRGECTAILWECIDFETGDVLIKWSVGYTPKMGIFFKPPKGGKPRVVTVSKDTLNMLKEWKADQEARGIDSQFVFTRNKSPEIMFPTSPTKRFADIGKRCGIKDFHPHKLRHTFASLNITGGADIASVSSILGHADKATTLRIYTHTNKQKRHEVSQKYHDAIHKDN